jgi:hypothetical protein
MRGIPLRVVQLSAQGAQVRTLKPWQAEVAQFTCDREAIDSAGKEQAESTPLMYRHASARKATSLSRDRGHPSSADCSKRRRTAGQGKAIYPEIEAGKLFFGEHKKE